MSDDPFDGYDFPDDLPDYESTRDYVLRNQEGRAEEVPILKADLFAWIDPSKLPIREWLLGRHLIRKFISVTVSPGGIGKSSLEIAEALSLVSGRSLIGHEPHGTFRVWYVNLEDPLDELQRRIIATAMHHGLDEADIEGRLFVNSGRDTSMVVATQSKNGVSIAYPVIQAIKETIIANQIDVLIIDPFVSCHAVSENDNGAINAVATAWAEIADATNCAIELVHHARKTGGQEVIMEDSRGGVALLSKARAGRVLNGMSREEAEKAGIENRGQFFRVDTGKANLAPRSSDASTWFKLESVPLHNGGDLCGVPLPGDYVGVVTAWEWPDPFEKITTADLIAAQAACREGGPWRENPQARDWVGRPIAAALKLDPDNKADRSKLARVLKTWITNGMFVVVQGMDAKSKPRPFIEVGTPATSTED